MAIIELRKGLFGNVTITDALAKARAGDTILVPPGTHLAANVMTVLQQGIRIYAEQPGTATLRGQFIVRGKLELENLTLVGNGVGIAVQGGILGMKHCTVSNQGTAAVRVSGGGLALLAGCEVAHCNESAFFVIDKGSSLRIGYCKVHDLGANGVVAKNQAQLYVEECEFSACGKQYPAVFVLEGAHGSAQNVRIHDTASNALCVKSGGKLHVTGGRAVALYGLGSRGVGQGEFSGAGRREGA